MVRPRQKDRTARRVPQVPRDRSGFREELLDALCASFEHCSVGYLVQRDLAGTPLRGAKNNFFLIRDIAGPAMTAAPMESCQFAARRPRGSFWVGVLCVCRSHRTRARLQHFFGQFSQQTKELLASLGQVCVPRPLGCCIDGISGAGAHPLPDLPREASRSRSAPEKSV